MSKLLAHPAALCNIVRRLAVEAGEITLDYFDQGMAFTHDVKADGSPVSEADREAERHIVAGLQDALPGVPVIAEEMVSRGEAADIAGAEYFWLVDPLDGTKEFVAGGPDFTVNIALIRNGEPVLGVIYAPALGELYAAHGEGTAIRWKEETDSEKPIQARKPGRGGLAVVVSKNRGMDQVNAYLAEHKVEKLIKRGSSLKICMVAAGKADLSVTFGLTCEWDTAAGHAILRAAGGDIVDMDGNPLTYGHQDKKFLNPDFVARSQYLDFNF